MRSKILMTALSAAIALMASAANADEEYGKVNQQNLSKRPYHKPVDAQMNKKDNFEGATLVDQEAVIDKKHESMRLHMLGKRPYGEKSTD